MAGVATAKEYPVAVNAFNGLKTDTPASKCPQDYSPDCSDLTFAPGGFATRNPFRVVTTMPAEIVFEKEFTGRDGTLYKVIVDINGAMYSVAADGTHTQIDSVYPGSQVNSVTAYGREYMAFFNAQGGCDAPRQWDGKNVYRVSQGPPAAAPTVTNLSLPPTALVTGTLGAPVAVTSATPSDLESVQVSDGSQDPDGGYVPPSYEDFYTTLTILTGAAHGRAVGDAIALAGNTLYGGASLYVSQVISATVLKVQYQQQNATPGTGGTITPSTPLLVRNNNIVQAFTATPHGLRSGFLVNLSGIADLSENITSITIDNDTMPGVATIVTPSPHGFVPGNVVAILDVNEATVGGGLLSYATATNLVTTVTTVSAHKLKVGDQVVVVLGAGGGSVVWTVTTVPSPSVFTFQNTHADGSGSVGSVSLQWAGDSGETFTVLEIVNPTTFTIAVNYTNGVWSTGTIGFPWNGTFYVTSVISSTGFFYRQIGPNAILANGTGTVTPTGQIAPGDHQVCQHFILADGSITGPSPAVKFSASGGQYALVQNILIGPANVVGRILSFTGANGSRFFMLLVPGQVNGLQVSTSTRIDDNVTTSAVMDFGDPTLEEGTGIDIPGFNLFQLVQLDTPRGVSWYGDRMWWWGGKNKVTNLLNMAFDGGPTGAALPGWTVIGTGGSVVQLGTAPAYSVTGGTGEIQQSAARTPTGNLILQPNQKYTLRFWQQGTGTLVVTVSSASTGFSTTASIALGTAGYILVNLPTAMPTAIPGDLLLDVKLTGVVGTASITDLQMIYSSNPNLNPIARTSYVQQPGMYDNLTGKCGPNDDNTELRAMFVLQESMHFLTAKRLYYVQSIGNQEPSSWVPDQISDKCGAFNSNSVATGKGYATWGGTYGAFRYSGGIPIKQSNGIAPTWRTVTTINRIKDEPDAQRVYFGVVIGGVKKLLVFDYHEMEDGGPGKWAPWNRPVDWVSDSELYGTEFSIGSKSYRLDTEPGTDDDDPLGPIGGYYTLAPFAASMFQKDFAYLGLRLDGVGPMTPFCYAKKLTTLTQALRAQELSTLIDIVAEWDMNIRGRLLFLKLGQPGVQFSLEEVTGIYRLDANSPISGTR